MVGNPELPSKPIQPSATEANPRVKQHPLLKAFNAFVDTVAKGQRLSPLSKVPPPELPIKNVDVDEPSKS